MLDNLVPADQVEVTILPGLRPDRQHAVAVQRCDTLVVLVPLAIVIRGRPGEQVAREHAQPQHRGVRSLNTVGRGGRVGGR